MPSPHIHAHRRQPAWPCRKHPCGNAVPIRPATVGTPVSEHGRDRWPLMRQRSSGLRRARMRWSSGDDVLVSCLASRTGLPTDAWAIDHQVHVNEDRRGKRALTHFRCRRVDGSRLRPSEILPCPAACIRVPSSRAALSSITSRQVRPYHHRPASRRFGPLSKLRSALVSRPQPIHAHPVGLYLPTRVTAGFRR